MKSVIACPICYGQGQIRITDYVENSVQRDRPVPCPGCAGRGVVHRATADFGVIEESEPWSAAQSPA